MLAANLPLPSLERQQRAVRRDAIQCRLSNCSDLVRLQLCLASQLANNLNATAGWSSTIPVCAYVVSIRNAAAPDKDGLLQVGGLLALVQVMCSCYRC